MCNSSTTRTTKPQLLYDEDDEPLHDDQTIFCLCLSNVPDVGRDFVLPPVFRFAVRRTPILVPIGSDSSSEEEEHRHLSFMIDGLRSTQKSRIKSRSPGKVGEKKMRVDQNRIKKPPPPAELIANWGALMSGAFPTDGADGREGPPVDGREDVDAVEHVADVPPVPSPLEEKPRFLVRREILEELDRLGFDACCAFLWYACGGRSLCPHSTDAGNRESWRVTQESSPHSLG